MKHVKQKQGLGTCGAVAYAAILELTELQGIRECNTKMRGKGSGTHHNALQTAFGARGIESHRVSLPPGKISQFFWLPLLSTHFPLYVSICENGSSHAVAIANELVYDGHNDGPVPLSLYASHWLDSIIIVDKELDSYMST